MSENVLRVASFNVNGIRAAARRGFDEWLEDRGVDILALQEVRAPDAIVEKHFEESDWHVLHAEAADKGRAGVLIASKREPDATRIGIGEPYFETSGRWVEADYTINGRTLTVVSAYVHSGEVDTPRQDDKYKFLETMLVRMPELAKHADDVLIVGDLNVGHTELDIKNWKGNVKNAGFLPEERAYFDKFFGEIGYKDVARELAGDVPGPYTWWSYRGKAFDNDAGWRIDYHMATPELAGRAIEARVDRAESYDKRVSDHSALVIDYSI
ncbi:exodeoxyribonuclease III [Arthrobacter sp. HMSC08H08]|uniref:exodeoxyribonuclease III n=1 Tax=Arthrobacter sp. HMSC08H08 TaxID=1581143 RepID=UPI0008A5F81F|nr:exodeoxyribonuclease III [Arthrobacter sp. HMSC08H08]OFT24485.1 exodeoxyribonuclease III [Arthrobacter sp. HMSC08H08]